MAEIPNFIRGYKRYYIEWLFFAGTLFGVIISLFSLIGELNKGFKSITGWEISPTNFAIISEIMNIGILVPFFVFLKTQQLVLTKRSEYLEIARLLNIQQDKSEDEQIAKVDFNNRRVNLLVGQLCSALGGFILFLILFYLIHLLRDAGFIVQVEDVKSESIQLVLGFVENFCNIVSAVFVYLGFKVLYDTTLDINNNSIINYRGVGLFLLGYFILYVILLLNNAPNVQEIFRLICGVYNGLAMGPLFGRITSMEYFFRDIHLNKHNLSKQFFHLGTVFILPLYVLAQPMFGVFNVNTYGNSEVFKAIVFLICFVGKAFFLLLVFKYIRYRWLHIYLHLSLANHGIPKDIAERFPQVAGTSLPKENSSFNVAHLLDELKDAVDKEDHGKCLMLIGYLRQYFSDTNSNEAYIVYQMEAFLTRDRYNDMLEKGEDLRQLLNRKGGV